MHQATRRTCASLPRQAGLTLLELLVGVCVAAISLGVALPSFQEASQRRDLDGAAAQLETDLQYARSQAVASDRTLRISFRTDAAGSCYVVHTGSADACNCAGPTGEAVCQSGTHAARSVRLPSAGPVHLLSNVPSIVFDPVKGTSSPTGTLRLQGRDAREVRLVVNVMGRVRSCTPDGLPGYRAC